MTTIDRIKLEQDAFDKIKNFIDSKPIFEIEKIENGYILKNDEHKYALEKSVNKFNQTYNLVIYLNDGKEIRFTQRPIANGDTYDELVILIENNF